MKEETMFFFEKKNQKTFARFGRHPRLPVKRIAGRHEQKFFGSFFQKRTLLLFLFLPGCASPPCLLAGQTRMEIVDLYFGRDIAGRAQVSDREWNDFAAREITPRFPAGFTVFEARGQWLNPGTGGIGREASRVVRVAVPAAADVAARVEAVSAAYRARFSQVAVGAVSGQACARW